MPMAVFDFADINARLKRIARNDQIELKPAAARLVQIPKNPFPPAPSAPNAPNNPGHGHAPNNPGHSHSFTCQRCGGCGYIETLSRDGHPRRVVCPHCSGKGLAP